MEKTKCWCVFYILLLTMTGPALCLKRKADDNQNSRQKRYAGVLPIAAYAGAAVSPWVWVALVAVYGIHLVRQYSIRRQSSFDSHNCANNRGWCRNQCFSHEYIDWYHTDICGSFKCCRPY